VGIPTGIWLNRGKFSITNPIFPTSGQGVSKNVPNGPGKTGKTVETVKKLRGPDATPLKRAEAGS